MVNWYGREVPFGQNLLFVCEELPQLVTAVEVCEDLWAPNPPSISHALSGATLIINPSASDEATGKDEYRRNLVSGSGLQDCFVVIFMPPQEMENPRRM